MDAIAAYIARDSVDAALRFYAAVDETCETLAQFPGLGRQRVAKDRELDGLRSLPVRHFHNYLVFYLTRNDSIEVLNVVHGSRDLPSAVGAE